MKIPGAIKFILATYGGYVVGKRIRRVLIENGKYTPIERLKYRIEQRVHDILWSEDREVQPYIVRTTVSYRKGKPEMPVIDAEWEPVDD